ncbi:MAG: nucleotidyltransferase [Bacteroidales bacterium]|nr:nucleotidyltransferase [Bacteroidales bacterium]MBQ7819490.1 nucleotidyltransferase [Bacteroidales bacterium]
MKPTLFVLAAGMGSRYGSLKQLDGLGPNGETIMDYSIFDAIRGGFGKVVFVIRHSFADEFIEKVVKKYEKVIPTEVVYQELDYLPEGFTVPEGREKPWGTNHAVMMGKEAIKEPFAVINADDFYGRESFAIIADWLSKQEGENKYCMVGYRVGNTMSESGTVSRGICETNENAELTSVVERTKIGYYNGGIAFNEGEEWTMLDPNVPVSMNMWGFTPDYFKYSDEIFVDFLKENMSNLKSEFFIPLIVNELIQSKRASVTVLDTPSKWFGVTYAQDRPDVVAKIQSLVDAGEYPSPLF